MPKPPRPRNPSGRPPSGPRPPTSWTRSQAGVGLPVGRVLAIGRRYSRFPSAGSLDSLGSWPRSESGARTPSGPRTPSDQRPPPKIRACPGRGHALPQKDLAHPRRVRAMPAKGSRPPPGEPQLMDRAPEPLPRCCGSPAFPPSRPCSSGNGRLVERLFFDDRNAAAVAGFCRELGKARKPYRQVDAEELARVAGTVLHGGVVAVTALRPIPAFDPAEAKRWAAEGKPCCCWTGSATRIISAPSCGPRRFSAWTAS